MLNIIYELESMLDKEREMPLMYINNVLANRAQGGLFNSFKQKKWSDAYLFYLL